MSRGVQVSRGAWLVVWASAVLCAASFALPRLHPVPVGADVELAAMRGERDLLAKNDDGALEALRRKVKEQPPVAWSVEEFMARVETGWRVEWQKPDGASRLALLTRSAPRLREWPEYHRFLRMWAAQPGVVLESLEVNARGTSQGREIARLVLGLRVLLRDEPAGAKPVGPDPPDKPPATVRSTNPTTQP